MSTLFKDVQQQTQTEELTRLDKENTDLRLERREMIDTINEQMARLDRLATVARNQAEVIGQIARKEI